MWDFSSRSPTWAGPQQGKHGVPGLPGNFPKGFLFIVLPLIRENRLYTFSQIFTQAYLILQLQQNWSYKEPIVSKLLQLQSHSPGREINIGRVQMTFCRLGFNKFIRKFQIYGRTKSMKPMDSGQDKTPMSLKNSCILWQRHELTFHINLQGNVQKFMIYQIFLSYPMLS